MNQTSQSFRPHASGSTESAVSLLENSTHAVSIDEQEHIDFAGQIAAIRRSQAVLEMAVDGRILYANENYLKMFGYTLEELRGQHHSIVVSEARRKSDAYKDLWTRINRGEFDVNEYMGVGKGGKEIWIQASFNPVFGPDGKPFKVVQFSEDITQNKIASLDFLAQIKTIRQTLCVAEFSLDCTIRYVNQNLLKALGYSEAELIGKSNSMLMSEEGRGSAQCSEVWNKLMNGDHHLGQFHLMSKDRREVILEACFSPVFDLNNKPAKVVLIATDITDQIAATQTMMEDVTELLQAAVNGHLEVRADENRHSGDFRKIIEGVNRTLDTVVAPLRSAAMSASTMASSSEELSAVSHQMSSNAEETAQQASVAASAADQVSKSVSSVAAAAQEMHASIGEISRSAAESARVAQSAVAVASSATSTVNKLGDSSTEIGKVIRVITSIAQQTNLLALNATIEAARAGEAGKGFAVVANEVKELAKKTAKATEEISQKIEAIQNDTLGAVKAIEEIGGIIQSVNGLSSNIASAVEEQSVTTNEIGRGVSEASQGVEEIARNIVNVAAAAKDTTQGAGQTQKASVELSHMAASLHKLVSGFVLEK